MSMKKNALLVATAIVLTPATSALAQDTTTDIGAADTRDEDDGNGEWGWLGLLGLAGLLGLKRRDRDDHRNHNSNTTSNRH
jgi:MYXO-CTERM domain-containing protein